MVFILRSMFYIFEKGVDVTIIVYILNIIVAGIVLPQTRYIALFPPIFKLILIFFHWDDRNLIFIKLPSFAYLPGLTPTFQNMCVVNTMPWKRVSCISWQRLALLGTFILPSGPQSLISVCQCWDSLVPLLLVLQARWRHLLSSSCAGYGLLRDVV